MVTVLVKVSDHLLYMTLIYATIAAYNEHDSKLASGNFRLVSHISLNCDDIVSIKELTA